MLGLPLTTGLAGFFPAAGIMLLIWGLMLFSAFYFLEVNLSFCKEVNFLSMVRSLLGWGPYIFSWGAYLLLLYALVSAYLLGSAQLMGDLFGGATGIGCVHFWLITVAFLFSLFLFFGTHLADVMNRLLMGGFALCFILIAILGAPSVEWKHLAYQDSSYLLASVSTMLTTFGFHVVIPTLTTYLGRQPPLLKRALLWGTLIPLGVYIIWEALVMGIVPVEGNLGLAQSALRGAQVTFSLKAILASPYLGILLRLFAFFAIITSLIGVSLSLEDFLADGLKISKKGLGRIGLLILTFLPPLLFTLVYPSGFVQVLHYGGILVLVLLVMAPLLMAFSRRLKNQSSTFVMWGGYPLITLLLSVSLVLLLLEIFT